MVASTCITPLNQYKEFDDFSLVKFGSSRKHYLSIYIIKPYIITIIQVKFKVVYVFFNYNFQAEMGITLDNIFCQKDELYIKVDI